MGAFGRVTGRGSRRYCHLYLWSSGAVPPIMGTLMNATTEAPRPSFAELFTPKLVTVLREGYEWQHLRADALAGPR